MTAPTLYHILRVDTDKDGGEIYVPHSANVGASSAEQALRSSVTETGRYVAIPRRSFVPVEVRIETKTSIKIGGES
jgi:hypothetical protein